MEENTHMLTFERIRTDVNVHRSLIQMKWEKRIRQFLTRKVTETA